VRRDEREICGEGGLEGNKGGKRGKGRRGAGEKGVTGEERRGESKDWEEKEEWKE